MDQTDDRELEDFFTETDELIQQAEEAMPYYENNGDWKTFSRLRDQLEKMPYTYVLVTAGPKADKTSLKNLNVDFWSVKGNDYKQFYDYITTRYGSILKEREICAAAGLLENVHQHVKQGVAFCVIKIVLGKYKRISVIDNGGGFYHYKKQVRLSVKDAIKFGRAYGSRYKSLGQALAITFGLWSDLATVETPYDSVIVTPERPLKKLVRVLFKIIFSLAVAVGTDAATLLVRQNISVIDIFTIVSIFGIVINWDRIKCVFRKEGHKKYFPEIKFKLKNRQQFGSSVNVYFFNGKNGNELRKQAIEELKIFLQKRVKSFRLQQDTEP
ncbi:hypothetical protein [Desulfonema magnum]|uniref:Uncharacterized protein n=1 Tax=Desulfonema magnum TaxID=45655 RepID=A0A975BVU0_9BACT|nr:hypothetical protein [Desulfonema magnum]QTA92432.1 Uncharacterized protein dnm_085120 [Desulfonema magnum]